MSVWKYLLNIQYLLSPKFAITSAPGSPRLTSARICECVIHDIQLVGIYKDYSLLLTERLLNKACKLPYHRVFILSFLF